MFAVYKSSLQQKKNLEVMMPRTKALLKTQPYYVKTVLLSIIHFSTGFPCIPAPRWVPVLFYLETGGWCHISPGPRCCSPTPLDSPLAADSPTGCGSLLAAPPSRRSPAACCTESPLQTTSLQHRGEPFTPEFAWKQTQKKILNE